MPNTNQMSEGNHGPTPGPWKIVPAAKSILTDRWDRFAFFIESEASSFRPCAVFTDGTENRGEAEANARLIVDAVNQRPALLEALKEAEAMLEAFHMEAGFNSQYVLQGKIELCIKKSRAAIAQAEKGAA